jgi:AcrR family transcriptional regulator
MPRPIELPAPGRGAYDRSLSRPERDAQHRERLLRATAEILLEGNLTVARIIQRAGVGRSTFYEFFDAPEHVVSHLEQRVLSRLEQALAAAYLGAHTPLERLRACVRSFLAVAESRPLDAQVALMRRVETELLSAAGKLFHASLTRVARAAQADGVSVLAGGDELSLLAAAASVETLTRRHLRGPALREPARSLNDLLVKILR